MPPVLESFRAVCAVVLLSAVAVRAGDIVGLGSSLTDLCKFMVDGYTYDICPIVQRNDGRIVFTDLRDTPPTVTKHHYHLSFGGPLPKNERHTDEEQCPEGTWVCLTKYNRPASSQSDDDWKVIETIPVAGDLQKEHCGPIIKHGEYYPGLNLTAYRGNWPSNDTPTNPNANLTIRLQGGYYVDQKQSMQLIFECEPSADEPTLDHVEGGWDGFHRLSVKTKHACALGVPPPPPSDTEQDLISLPTSTYTARKVWMILISSLCALILVFYCVRSPPQRLRARLQKFLRDHPRLLRFRVGENVLVRWAYEDLALEEGEEDVMVNGAEPIFVGDEEQIPLKPSPRKGRHGSSRFASYGIAK